MHVYIRDASGRKLIHSKLIFFCVGEIFLVILKYLTIIPFFGEYKTNSIFQSHYENMLMKLKFVSDDSEKFDFFIERNNNALFLNDGDFYLLFTTEEVIPTMQTMGQLLSFLHLFINSVNIC